MKKKPWIVLSIRSESLHAARLSRSFWSLLGRVHVLYAKNLSPRAEWNSSAKSPEIHFDVSPQIFLHSSSRTRGVEGKCKRLSINIPSRFPSRTTHRIALTLKGIAGVNKEGAWKKQVREGCLNNNGKQKLSPTPGYIGKSSKTSCLERLEFLARQIYITQSLMRKHTILGSSVGEVRSSEVDRA